MENNLVSIIVPVYNVEKYLEECLQSILNQTYKNIEVILIDDGSTDSSSIICDEYSNRYSNIQVLHQENNGVSCTRNLGLKYAKGDYIHFCDSDDLMKLNMIEYLVNLGNKYKSEVIIFGYELVPSQNVSLPQLQIKEPISGSDYVNICKNVHSSNELCFSWRFFYDLNYLKKTHVLYNEKIKLGEDFLFNLETIMQSTRMLSIQKPLYQYRVNNVNSFMRIKYKPDLEKQVQIQYDEKIKLTYKYGLNKNKNYMDDLSWYYINAFAGMLFRNAVNGPLEDFESSVKSAIRLPAIRNNYSRSKWRILKNCRYRNGWFRLFCYLKLDNLVIHILKKQRVDY